jgi:hypothetical protein
MELSWLDEHRGTHQRGEYLRMASLGVLPPVISTINRDIWLKLSRAAGNINQIARYLNTTGADIEEIEQIRTSLTNFRRALIGADLAQDMIEEP